MKRRLNLEKNTVTITMTLEERIDILTALRWAIEKMKDNPHYDGTYHKTYKEIAGYEFKE